MSTLKISDLSNVEKTSGYYAPIVDANTEPYRTKKFNLGGFIEESDFAIVSGGIEYFDEDKTYYPGDYVQYGTNAYKFINEHSRTWDPSDVVKVTAMKEIIKARSMESTQTTRVTVISDDSNFNRANINITINTEGETQTLPTNSNGQATFDLVKNVVSTVSAESKTGYSHTNDLTIDSFVDLKDVYINYKKEYSKKTITMNFNFVIDSENNDIDLDSEVLGKELLVFINDSTTGTFFYTPIYKDESDNIKADIIFDNLGTNPFTIYMPTIPNYDLTSVDAGVSLLTGGIIKGSTAVNSISVTYNRDKHDKQVEYITSTGTQIINMGLSGRGALEFRVKFKYSSSFTSSTPFYVFGNYIDTNNNVTRLMVTNGGSYPKYASANIDSKATSTTNTNFNSTTNTITPDVAHTITLSKGTSGFSEVLDEGTSSETTVKRTDYTNVGTASTQNTTNMALFGSNISTPTAATPGLTIYYLKIWNDGVLVRSYIPYSTTMGVGCLYDEVEHKYYYNKGTGNFVVGPEVN